MTGFLSQHHAPCPPALLARARKAHAQRGDTPMRLGFVRASAPMPMQSAYHASRAGIITPVLIGEAEGIDTEAEALGWDLSGIAIHHTEGEAMAIEVATRLVKDGVVDALMKGHLHSDVFMKGIVNRDSGIRGSGRMVHIFALYPPDGGKPLLVSDAAVNVAPDLKTQQQSLISMVEIAQALGVERPKIAILSATETPIASIPASLEAAQLAQWAKTHIPEADFAGPLSLDLALAPQAVAIKGIEGNAVAGAADGVLVPDILSGNILFKSLVWHGGACAAGVVMGGAVPIILTSRADSHEARMASIALASILGGGAE